MVTCARRPGTGEEKILGRIRSWINGHLVAKQDIQAHTLSELKRALEKFPYARLEILSFPGSEKPEAGAYLTGTGILCRRDGNAPGKVLVAGVFKEVAAHTPCWRGDEVLEVDGTPVTALSIAEIHRRMWACDAPGSVVRLKVRRMGHHETTEFSCPITRLPRPTAWGARFLDPVRKIGYLRVERFTADTKDEIRANMEILISQGLRALVLDLRFNEGGRLSAACRCAGLFMEGTHALEIEGRTPEYSKVIPAGSRYCPYPLRPLALLVNGKTASAAEVFAGLLQEGMRAVLVGEPTFGKGAVLAEKTFQEGELRVRVRVPVALCRLPSGRYIDRRIPWRNGLGHGLEPELKVPVAHGEEDHLASRLHRIPFLEEARGERNTGASEAVDAQTAAALHELKKQLSSD